MASSTGLALVAGDEQSAQQDLRDRKAGMLHRLELRAGEGAHEQAERRPEDGIRDRHDGQQPDRALQSSPSSPTDSATASADWIAATTPKAMAYPRGSRACPSASPAAVRACRTTAHAGWSPTSPGT